MLKRTHFNITLVVLAGIMLLLSSCGKQPGASADECTLSGKVVDINTDKGISNITISVMLTLSEDKPPTFNEIVSDENGCFSLTAPMGSSCGIYASFYECQDYLFDMDWLMENRSGMIQFDEISEDQDGIVLELKVRPSVTLSGKVIDSDGNPLPGTQIFLTRYMPPTVSDADGTFVLKAAPADKDFEVFAASEDYSLLKMENLKAASTEAVITLEPSCSITGQAIAEDGKPAAELTLQMSPYINGDSIYLPKAPEMCKTDAEGKFSISNLCKGARYQAAWHFYGDINADYKEGSMDFTAEADKSVEITNVKRFIDNWREAGNVAISEETKCGSLTNYCLDNDDNILACDGKDNVIRVISPADKLISTWKLDFSPGAIACRADGTVVVAGGAQAAILDKEGKVLKQAGIPGYGSTGVGCSGEDIFIAVSKGTSYAVYRMDSQLENQTQIIKGLRGCCGQMDITARDGVVYVAANTLFKVLKYDREGKEIARFGKQGREGDDTFKGCCEPKNVCFDTDGNLYTSESEQCCIKKFSVDGQFLAPIGNVNGIRGCVRVTIAVSGDKSRMYMLDTARNIIRKFAVSKVAAASK